MDSRRRRRHPNDDHAKNHAIEERPQRQKNSHRLNRERSARISFSQQLLQPSSTSYRQEKIRVEKKLLPPILEANKRSHGQHKTAATGDAARNKRNRN